MSNEEQYEEVVEITIGSALKNIQQAQRDAADLAWDHATELAKSTNLSLGSDEFETVYRELAARYDHQTEHLKFFMLTALLTLRELMDMGVIALPCDGDRITENEIVEGLSRASSALVGSFMWLAAGYELTWPSNDEMPHEVKVPFYFHPEEIEMNDDYTKEE